MQRRLAAIVIADVVEYGRLSHVDEEGTRAKFQCDVQEIFEPAIAAHHGRLVKTMGDALLIEFASVVDAVRCAVELQRAKARRNAALPPDSRLEFRIGINLGDIIVEGDDVHGDGVNIAERLQGLAEPGGISISGTTFDHVHSKLAFGFEPMGAQQVKNIAEPVEVFRVRFEGAPAKRMTPVSPKRRLVWAAAVTVVMLLAGGAWLALRTPAPEPAVATGPPAANGESSLVVLPFANLSDEKEQSYLADGITEDLTTELARVPGLFVISRNAAFTYKDKGMQPAQIAKELGVRYILEGSTRRIGDEMRINAQLIDAQSGGHVWAERFDGQWAEVFALQDKVTRSVSDALALRLTSKAQQIMDQTETKVPAAYDMFLRGWEHFRRGTFEDYAKAIPYFEQAITLDSDYGRAYAALALVYQWIGGGDWHQGQERLDGETLTRIDRYLHEAEKHPTATFHQAAGILATGYKLFPKAVTEFGEAIALDPSDSLSYAYMARALTFASRPAEASKYIRTAMRVDPHYPAIFLSFLGFAQFGLEQFEEAATSFEKATKLNPDDGSAFLLLGATYGYLGRKQDAVSAIAAYNKLGHGHGRPPITAIFARGTWAYLKRADQDRLFDGLILAGVPERIQPKP